MGSQVYDNGAIFSPEVLDITDDDIIKKFASGISNIAAASLAMGYPTVASVPHSIVNGFRNIAAVCLEADIDIPQIQGIKEYLADPSKFAAAAPAATEEKKEEGKKEEAKKEESDESGSDDDDMGFGLFD